MLVTAIAAIDRLGLIGANGKLPWHLPRDMRRFRERTMGRPVVMGRRTFDSLRAPLGGRFNVVLSRDQSFRTSGAISGSIVAYSVADAMDIAIAHASISGCDEVMIIGGESVFRATAHLLNRALLTLIDDEFPGDAHFLEALYMRDYWRPVERERFEADADNPHAMTFLTLERT